MTAAEKTRLLAERVMGWKTRESLIGISVKTPDGRWLWIGKRGTVNGQHWSPLTNLAHAGEVLEAMRAKGCDYLASTCPVSKRHWFAFFSPYESNENYREFYAYANEFSTAICHAALLAHGVKEEEL